MLCSVTVLRHVLSEQYSCNGKGGVFCWVRPKLGSSDVVNIRGLNLAVVNLTTVQVTKLPL
jgi:hypothetical protein